MEAIGSNVRTGQALAVVMGAGGMAMAVARRSDEQALDEQLPLPGPSATGGAAISQTTSRQLTDVERAGHRLDRRIPPGPNNSTLPVRAPLAGPPPHPQVWATFTNDIRCLLPRAGDLAA